MTNFDVYSFGMVSASTLYGICDDFPIAEGYAEIEGVRHMTGGEAASSSIVLSRLGARVKLDGNWLGADEAGQRTKALLDGYGIDTSRLPLQSAVTSVQEVVIADSGTRTIFGTYRQLQDNRAWNTADEADIRGARIVCLDPFFGEASLHVARTAHADGIPVVTVDCRHDEPLLEHVSALVISESYLREHYAGQPLEGVFDAYVNAMDGLLVFTFGDREIWYAESGSSKKTARPFGIDPADTTGGGDAFRAGVVYGQLQRWNAGRTVAYAAAVAAIVCTRFPGVMNAPTRGEVEAFMQVHNQHESARPTGGR